MSHLEFFYIRVKGRNSCIREMHVYEKPKEKLDLIF